MDPSTRFDDDEVRRILAGAADRQVRADEIPVTSGTDPGPGLSLAQIQEAAREAGIDPSHVTAAARELRPATHAAGERYPFLGVPRQIAAERLVPATVDDRGWERIVAEARRQFGSTGVTERFGDVREWTSSAEGSHGAVRLRLAPHAGTTHVALGRSTRSLSSQTHAAGWPLASIAALITVAGFTGGFGDAVAGVVVPLSLWALTGATFVIGRMSARGWARRTADTFERLLDRIDLIARDES